MPRHFPVLRLLVPIAALGAGLSLVVGIVAAVTLLVMGIAGGRPLGGVINGLAAAAAGVAAAFSLAAIGEAAEVLLQIAARSEVPDRLHDHLVGEGQRTDERHLEAGEQIPIAAHARPHAGCDAEVGRAAAGEPGVQVGGHRRAEVLEDGGVARREVDAAGPARRTK